MSDLTRRELVTLLGVTAAAAACGRRPGGQSAESAQADSTAALMQAPQFFTPHEFATVTLLANLVIPADERSGGASDAGVPGYIDFALREVEDDVMRLGMRGGLAWLDAESGRRFGRRFVDAAPGERTAILDDIAWPARTPPALANGAAFFSDFRDLVATAFWSSRLGVRDLQYQGNVALPEWSGCPDAALRKLGVSYGPERTA
ncbi:MAG: gluconate 2-dehydrogenase subunit 3 family protein [Gemmatimonadales bacterium]